MIYFTHNDLISFIDAKYSLEPDFTLTMEVVDVMNKSIDQSLQVINIINEGLESTDSNNRLKTTKFLEILVKNSSIEFHKNLFSNRFCNILLKILSRRRKKFDFFNPLISGNKKKQEEIENWLLFLIQLWFDTFMFYEDQYKSILNVYKQLWQEGVVFPLRDPKSQHYINFPGRKSPIFDTIEGNKIYEEPNKQFSLRKYRVQEINVSADVNNDLFGIRKSQKNDEQTQKGNEEYLNGFISACEEFINNFNNQTDCDYDSIDLLIEQNAAFQADIKEQNGSLKSEYLKKTFQSKLKALQTQSILLNSINQQIKQKVQNKQILDNDKDQENISNDFIQIDQFEQTNCSKCELLNLDFEKFDQEPQTQQQLQQELPMNQNSHNQQLNYLNYDDQEDNKDPFAFVDKKFKEIIQFNFRDQLKIQFLIIYGWIFFSSKENISSRYIQKYKASQEAQEWEKVNQTIWEEQIKKYQEKEFQQKISQKQSQKNEIEKQIQQNELEWMYEYKPQSQQEKREQFLLGKEIKDLEQFSGKEEKQKKKQENEAILKLYEDPLIQLKQHQYQEKQYRNNKNLRSQTNKKNDTRYKKLFKNTMMKILNRIPERIIKELINYLNFIMFFQRQILWKFAKKAGAQPSGQIINIFKDRQDPIFKPDKDYPIWLFQLMDQKEGYKKSMRYYMLQDCEFNEPQLHNMPTFYWSWRKQKVKLLNQLYKEQFSDFDNPMQFHDEMADELEDGGYELEELNKQINTKEQAEKEEE